jgi:gamma-glutamylcyclotransferase
MNYFAFGSNMDPKRLANRGLIWTKDEVAVLDGYEMRCDVLCDRIAQHCPGCGTANITSTAGGKVEGILYTLPDGELEKLDVFEGHPTNHTREVVSVQRADGTVIEAVTYMAHPEKIHDDLRPHPDYLAHILAGARGRLSPEYVAMLEAIQPLVLEE